MHHVPQPPQHRRTWKTNSDDPFLRLLPVRRTRPHFDALTQSQVRKSKHVLASPVNCSGRLEDRTPRPPMAEGHRVASLDAARRLVAILNSACSPVGYTTIRAYESVRVNLI